MTEPVVDRHRGNVDGPRDGRGKWIKGHESVERDLEAMRLRNQSWTWQRISDHLGYGDEANVRRAVKAMRAQIVEPAVAEYRAEIVAQLDELMEEARQVLDTTHYVFHQGAAVRVPAADGDTDAGDGALVVDTGPTLRAIAELRALLDKKADVIGAKAPVRVDQTTDATVRYVVEGVDMGKLR